MERMFASYEKALGEALAGEGAEGTPVIMSSTVLTTSARTGSGENPERSWD